MQGILTFASVAIGLAAAMPMPLNSTCANSTFPASVNATGLADGAKFANITLPNITLPDASTTGVVPTSSKRQDVNFDNDGNAAIKDVLKSVFESEDDTVYPDPRLESRGIFNGQASNLDIDDFGDAIDDVFDPDRSGSDAIKEIFDDIADSIFKRADENREICGTKNPSLASAVAALCAKDIVIGNDDYNAVSDPDILQDGIQWGVTIKGSCADVSYADKFFPKIGEGQLLPREYCESQFYDICANGDEDGAGDAYYGDDRCQYFVIPSKSKSYAGLDWGFQ